MEGDLSPAPNLFNFLENERSIQICEPSSAGSFFG